MSPTGFPPAQRSAAVPLPRLPADNRRADADTHHHADTRDAERRSRFTYRNLADLAAASPTCPLRVIAHIDLDAYYAQCEMLRLGTDEETPLVVQQWRNIIAVNYPARKFGISRMISAQEAKRLCPDLVVQHVPTWKEGESQWAYHADAYSAMSEHKVSLEPYRIRSREILAAIKDSLPSGTCKLEKAGIDEVFVDLSAYVHSLFVKKLYPDLLAAYRDHHQDEPTTVLPLPPVTEAELDWASTGSDVIDIDEDREERNEAEDQSDKVEDHVDKDYDYDDNGDRGQNDRADEKVSIVDWDDIAMLEGARIIRSVRQALYDKLRFRCSAGIASNKMLSKLGSSQHKPNKQTVVRSRAVAKFLTGLSSVSQLRGLGGKMGSRVVGAFDTKSIAELLSVSLAQMQSKLGDQETGYHIYWMIRGVDNSEVTARTEIKSIISAKSFQPPLKSMDQALRWLRVFVAEIKCRLLDQKLSLALLAAATVSTLPPATSSEAAATAEVEKAAPEGADKKGAQNGGDQLQSIRYGAPAQQQELQVQRLPQTIRLHYGNGGGFHWRSRQARIPRDGTPLDEEKLLRLGTQLLEQTQRSDALWPCAHLAISVDGFEEPVKGNKSIESFFQPKSTSSAAAGEGLKSNAGDKDDDDDEGDDKDYENDNLDVDNVGYDNDMPLPKRRRTDVPADATLSDEEGRTKKEEGGAELSIGVDEQPGATSNNKCKANAFGLLSGSSRNSSNHQTPGMSSSNDGSKTSTSDGGPFQCDRCSKPFPTAVQLQEHQDWHVARALQAKEKIVLAPPSASASSSAQSRAPSSTALPPATTTRRRGHVPVKRTGPPPISSFFQNRAKSPTKARSSDDNSGENSGGSAAAHPLVCTRCAAAFDHPDGLQVHEDWHFAKDLETG